MPLFVINNPWVFALGILGNVISIIVYLAPAPTFYRIFRRRSTEGFHSFPYVVSLLSSMLWIDYAIVKSDVLLIIINSIGCLIEAIYILFFIAYAPKKPRISTLMLVFLLNIIGFGLVCILTEFLTKGRPQKIRVLGWICVSVTSSVFIAPLSIMKHVISTRSVEYMPFWLSFSLVWSAVTWFLYGLLLKDIFITVPNVVGFFFGMAQMGLYVKYKDSNNLETADTYPVFSSTNNDGIEVVMEEKNENVQGPIPQEHKEQDPPPQQV